jgi:hypothetical protein
MKNIFMLPTDKPSRLGYLTKKGKEVFNDLRLFEKSMPNILDSENQHIYITSDEDIKEGDYSFYPPFGVGKNIFIDGELCFHIKSKDGKGNFTQRTYQTLDRNKKIILTIDQDLIADEVQSINDNFLKWFVKNPSCESVEIEDWYSIYLSCCQSKEQCSCNKKRIIIPKEEFKKETLKEFAKIDLTKLCYYDKRNPDCSADDEDIEDHKRSLIKKNKTCSCDNCFYDRTELTEQLISQAKRMYSEEEVKPLLDAIKYFIDRVENGTIQSKTTYKMYKEIFEQFKKK